MFSGQAVQLYLPYILVENQPSFASEDNQETSVFVAVSLESSLVLHFHICKSTDDFCLSGSLCVTKLRMAANSSCCEVA